MRCYSLIVMEIRKANWSSDGDNIRLTMPISKIDKANRLVSGWATLDNIDTQGDIVLARASNEAFQRFRGNIREMHQPIAVGRLVDFREDSFYDPNTEKMYKGVFVTAYVSKGAESTWEKVLDGTLTGFSIGGAISKSSPEYLEELNKTVRVVEEYDLSELSLVDNPANQLANILSIQKSADGTMVLKGMSAETHIENVFWCSNEEIAKTSTEENVDCTGCGSAMTNIGWIEYDDSDRTEKVKGIVAAYRSSNTNSAQAEIAKQADPANEEGGVDVAEENEAVEPVEEVEETAETEAAENAEVAEEVASEEEATAETTEKAADVSEVGEEPDFAKMFGDLQASIEKSLETSRETVEKAVATVEEKVSDLAAKYDEVVEKFAALEAKTENLGKAVDSVVAGTAVKKSGDLGGSQEETLEKSSKGIWGGRFLSTSGLTD